MIETKRVTFFLSAPKWNGRGCRGAMDHFGESILLYLREKQTPERAGLVSLAELEDALQIVPAFTSTAIARLRSEHLVEVVDLGHDEKYAFITGEGRAWSKGRV